MTISKERMNEIALEVAKSFICEMEGYIYFGSNPGIPEDDITDFAHTLLKAVETESEVVGQGLFDTDGKCYAIGQHKSSMCVGGKAFKSAPLVALPLGEGE